jgi:hypothetical protein
MAITSQMQARIGVYARQLAAELGEVDASNALSWLDAVETQAVEISDAIAAEVVRQKSVDRPVEEGESFCPECGGEGRYRRTRQRSLVTRRGPTTIDEPEYYCPCCRKAFFPDDQNDRR